MYKKTNMRIVIFLFCTGIFLGNILVVKAQDIDNLGIDSLNLIDVKAPVKTISTAFADLPVNKVVGAIAEAEQSDFITTDLNVQASLIGRIPGLQVSKFAAAPGRDAIGFNLRGRSPIIVIDGVAGRSLSTLNYYEIESITVLKDITAKMLYGSAGGADGVVLVKTKRGKPGQKRGSLNYERGTKQAIARPDYLNSLRYAELYNEARVNDGLPEQYSAEELQGYKDVIEGTSEADKLRFPNVDFNDEFLNESTNFNRIFGTYTFSDNNINYFFSGGYINERGFEKIGDKTKYERVNLRSNLDYKVNKVLSAQLDVAFRLEFNNRGRLSNGEFYNALASHRPNDYPLFVDTNTNDGVDSLGWSPIRSNLYGDLTEGGFAEELFRIGQVNFGLNFDLNSFVKGLSAKTYLTFDSYNATTTGRELTYQRYKLDRSVVGEANQIANDALLNEDFFRNYGFISSLDFERTSGDHAFLSNLVLFAQNRQFRGTGQDDKNFNLGYRLNYTFANKYILEADMSLMGSGRLEQGNNTKFFPAAGLGWVISEEDFLSDVDVLDFLKVKSSYGIMGYDRSLFNFLFTDSYNFIGGSNVAFGPTGANSEFAFAQTRAANPNITFEENEELNIGVEGTIFKNLSFEYNYFKIERTGMPVQIQANYPDYIGRTNGNGGLPFVNFAARSSTGYEIGLNYGNSSGDFVYNIGANAANVVTVHEKLGEVVAFDHLNREGTRVDAIWGYRSEGFYKNQEEIDDHGVVSTLGGELRPGDLRYTDITGDGIIDANDITILGNSDATVNYAVNVRLAYKGFGLFMLGQGVVGGDRLLWNNYFRNNGEDKYSVNALNRWTEATAATATHPRLTTTGNHSYTTSSFWVEKSDYFTLRNVELSYSFSRRICRALGASELLLYVRGTDLATISKRKDISPDFVNGITSSPLRRTMSMGITIAF